MVKIVTLFLVFIAVLAMIGKLGWLGIGSARSRGKDLPKPKLCPDCGRYNLRGGPCRHCKNGQG